MNMQKFLDSKHGKFIGRVYLGVAGTVACIAVLSTPTKIESNQDS